MNVRLPGHLTDVLMLLAYGSAPGARSAAAAVLRILLDEFGNNPTFARRVKKLLNDSLAEGPADHDLSVRVPSHIVIAMDDMAELVGISTRSDVVRGVLVAAKQDVLDGRDPTLANAVDKALTAVA